MATKITLSNGRAPATEKRVMPGSEVEARALLDSYLDESENGQREG